MNGNNQMRKMNANEMREIELLTNDFTCMFDELLHDEYVIHFVNNDIVYIRNVYDDDIQQLSIERMKQCMNYVSLMKTFFDKCNMYFECVDENDESNKFNVHAFALFNNEYVNARVNIDENNVVSIIGNDK